MRCLQVNKFWYHRAGADVYAMGLARELTALHVLVRVLSTRHPDSVWLDESRFWPIYHELSRNGASLRPMERLAAAGKVFFNPGAGRAVARLLAEYPMDIAHVHNVTKHLGPAALLALRRRGVPVVATVHDHWPVCPTYTMIRGDGTTCDAACSRHGAHQVIRHRCASQRAAVNVIAAAEFGLHRLLHWGVDLADVAIAPSQYLADRLASHGVGSKVVVIRHPHPRHEWVEPPDTPLRVLYVGRLAREKGVEVLIEAARAGRWRVDIAGRGPEEASLRRLATDVSSVRFLGFLAEREVVSAMRAAHVVVVPSLCYENAPLVVLEALGVGRIVVASAIGGIPEYLPGAPSAFPTAAGDVVALRHTLDEVAAMSKAERRDGCRGAWEWARARPAWPEHARQIVDLYRSTLDHRQ